MAGTVWRQVGVLRRIPEQMDPSLYYRTFRPYIRFFENVVYEGVVHEGSQERPMNFRGETGAQSSIMPMLVALMKIRHRPSVLTDHLADMRRFMPAEHREPIEEVQAMPDVRGRWQTRTRSTTCWRRWPRSARCTTAGPRSTSTAV